MNRTAFIGTEIYYSQAFVDDRIKEIKRLKQANKNIYETSQELLAEKQAIIDEAIEYINNHTNNGMFELRSDTNEIKELLEILKGGE